MACNVTVLSVRGVDLISAGQPRFIEIGGTAQECAQVIVTLALAVPMSIRVPVLANGSWLATFNMEGKIHCGAAVKVSAYCENDPNCTSGPLERYVECAEDCPSTVTLEIRDSAGNVVNPSAIPCLNTDQYSVHVLLPADLGTNFWWSVGGVQQTGQNQSTFNINLPPGSQTQISVVVAPPQANCPPLSGAVNLVVCSNVCPNLTGIDITGCWPGNVNLRAQGNDLGLAQTFDWDFGDGTIVTGGSIVPHTYANNGPFTVTVTMVGPPGCSPRTQSTSKVIPPCENGDPPTIRINGGGFDWCYIPLVAWLAGFIALGMALYWNAGPAAVATSAAAYAAGLFLWVWKCCDCKTTDGAGIRGFIRNLLEGTILCCGVLQWHLIALGVLIAAMGNYQWVFDTVILRTPSSLLPVPNPTVLGVYAGFLLTVFTALMAIPGCDVPNPFVASTYPGVRCRRRR